MEEKSNEERAEKKLSFVECGDYYSGFQEETEEEIYG